ncbi:MAG: Ca-activated chloride channel family protein, partial [Flavobacteriales bacterium]
NTDFLYLVLLIPALLLMYLVYLKWRWAKLNQLVDLKIIDRLGVNYSIRNRNIKTTLFLTGLLFLILSAANLQLGSELKEIKLEGVDIMVALDLSKSMNAEDVTPSRLERSKRFMSELISKLGNDRVGIIIFAGNAYTQMPLTVDHGAARLFLSSLSTNIIPTQGTSLSEAMKLAGESFEQEDTKYKVLILITDGEDHEGDVEDRAEELAESGVIIHCVGVGSPNGGPIPIYQRGNQVDFERDGEGNIVLSKLNTTVLSTVAAAGKGKFYPLNNAQNDLKELIETIAKMEKKEQNQQVFSDYDDKYQYFLAITILLLLIGWFIPEKVKLK